MTLLTDLQSDILGRLLSCPDFDTVGITVLQGTGSKSINITRDEIDAVLTGLKLTNDKSGLGVIILMPEVRIETGLQTVPGPQIQVRCSVQIVENADINRSDHGTQIRAEELAYTVLSLLHLFQPRSGVLLLADERAIEAAELDEDVPATNAYQVNLTAPMSTMPAAKVPAPTLAYAAGALTLSGASGAAHYVSTDGSYPRPGAQGSSLYAAAITLPTGLTVRAASYLPDYVGSDVAETTTA